MVLETKRMTIRDFEPADQGDLHEILGDPQTMAFSEPPYSPAQTRSFLMDFCIGRRAAQAAALKESGKVIGYLLFKPLGRKEWEIGWFFNRRYWRQGLAFEAGAALVDWAFQELGAQTITAETADLVKSAGLMQKLGMTPEGRDAAGLACYSLSAQDWRRMKKYSSF
ncbi:MAG: GNAT family N-acetyltransferase [Clostridiaceae bacterium]|jgi:ribosomal-protein-alanine N-acetyltransferase|nr:GNAT family N-acetyltransferase [Clostridiaceae bacterium]